MSASGRGCAAKYWRAGIAGVLSSVCLLGMGMVPALAAYTINPVITGAGNTAWRDIIDFNGDLYLTKGGTGATAGLYRFQSGTLTQVGNFGSMTELWEFDGSLYFGGQTADNRRLLHRYDGSTTTQLSTTQELYSEWNPAVYNGHMYFASNNGDVWRTDGANVELVTNAIPSLINAVAGYDGKLFVTANNGFYSVDLGSGSVANEASGLLTQATDMATVYDGALYFSANQGNVTGWEMYRYTAQDGVIRVHDQVPGSGSFLGGGRSEFWWEHDGKLYLAGRNPNGLYAYAGGLGAGAFTLIDDDPQPSDLGCNYTEMMTSWDGKIWLSSQSGGCGNHNNGQIISYVDTGAVDPEITQLTHFHPIFGTNGIGGTTDLVPLGDCLYFLSEVNTNDGNLYAVRNDGAGGYDPNGGGLCQGTFAQSGDGGGGSQIPAPAGAALLACAVIYRRWRA